MCSLFDQILLGERLRQLRKKHGMTQEALAKQLEIRRVRYVYGKRKGAADASDSRAHRGALRRFDRFPARRQGRIKVQKIRRQHLLAVCGIFSCAGVRLRADRRGAVAFNGQLPKVASAR